MGDCLLGTWHWGSLSEHFGSGQAATLGLYDDELEGGMDDGGIYVFLGLVYGTGTNGQEGMYPAATEVCCSSDRELRGPYGIGVLLS